MSRFTDDDIEALERIVLAMAAAHIGLSEDPDGFVHAVTAHLLDGLQPASQDHKDRVWPFVQTRLRVIEGSLEALHRNGG